MKIVKFIALFIGLLLVSLIVTLPASVILKQVTLDKDLSIGSVQGAWWSFNVDWLSYRGVTFDKTEFSVNPSCLLLATVCIDVTNTNAQIHLKKPLFNNVVSAEESEINMNFDQLSPLMTALFVKPTGDFKLYIRTLDLSNQTISALSATLNWQNVGVQGESFNLGSINATVKHQPEMISLTLSDQSPLLDLSGQVKISKAGYIDSQIQIKTLANFPPQIKTVIQSLMQKRGRDVFEYKAKVNNRQLKALQF